MKRISVNIIRGYMVKPDNERGREFIVWASQIAQAQLEADEKELRELFKEIESGIYALELDLRVEDMATLYGLLQSLKKKLGGE